MGKPSFANSAVFGQFFNLCKWRHLVAKFPTNARTVKEVIMVIEVKIVEELKTVKKVKIVKGVKIVKEVKIAKIVKIV